MTGSFGEGHGLNGIVCLRFDTFYLYFGLFQRIRLSFTGSL